VIERWLPLGLGESPQCSGKGLQGLKHRVIRQIQKRGPNVFAMMKVLMRERAIFKTIHQFLVCQLLAG
jgi:hypothetical protein